MSSLVQMNINFDSVVEKMQQDAHGPRYDVLFSGPPITGDELKDEGMAKSLQKKANRKYRDNLIETLKVFPVRSRITVEQLTGILGRPEGFGATHSCIGSSIHHMARLGLIRKTGRMLKPGRKERHSNQIPEWEVVRYS